MEGEGSRVTEPLEGQMEGTLEPTTVSTKLQRIAELARKARSFLDLRVRDVLPSAANP